MLTLAIAFLIIALVAALFGFIVVGPVGVIVSLVFLGLFIWSWALYRRDRRKL